MSDAAPDARPSNASQQFAFTHIFRSFRLAIHWAKLLLAFAGVFATYLGGRALDGLWASSCQVLCVETAPNHTFTEIDQFLAPRTGEKNPVRRWIDAHKNDADAARVGVFDAWLLHSRRCVNAAATSVLHADLGGLLAAIHNAIMGCLWLWCLHSGYAVVFTLWSLLVWALFGGAVARVAALHAARDERIGPGEALRFAKSKLGGFFFAPLMPLAILAVVALLLFIFGLVGLIPALGELLVGLLFLLALLGGFVAAFVTIGGLAGLSLMYPTIAVEASDAFDALSRTYAYIYQRPWRAAFYGLVALAYGAICFLFVKLFTRLLLAATHLFLGMSMNWGSAFVKPDAPNPGKLEALWTAPSLVGQTPMIGRFDATAPAHVSWLSQLLIKVWIYSLWGLVAAFVVSFFLSACTIIYLLLRREVDAADLEDVYIEDAAATEATDETKPASGGSLPILGQNP